MVLQAVPPTTRSDSTSEKVQEKVTKNEGRGGKEHEEKANSHSYLGSETGLKETGPKEEQQKDEIFKIIADSIPQIVWTAHPNGDSEYHNSKWYEYSGLTPEQSKGFGWHNVLHPDDKKRSDQLWKKAVETGETYEIEYRFRRASDGVYRWFLGRALPLRNESGQIVKSQIGR